MRFHNTPAGAPAATPAPWVAIPPGAPWARVFVGFGFPYPFYRPFPGVYGACLLLGGLAVELEVGDEPLVALDRVVVVAALVLLLDQ
jgi:hypothetical protein